MADPDRNEPHRHSDDPDAERVTGDTFPLTIADPDDEPVAGCSADAHGATAARDSTCRGGSVGASLAATAPDRDTDTNPATHAGAGAGTTATGGDAWMGGPDSACRGERDRAATA